MAADKSAILWLLAFGFFASTLSIDGPMIQPFGFPKNSGVGSKVNVHCSLSRGTVPVIFMWKKDGEVVNIPEEEGRVFTYDTFSMMEINRVKASDVGNYTCLVKNSVGEDSFTAELLVKDIWIYK
ncbi:junctional adhesion molecule A-like isoform X2 [Tachypleus tridentatus]|uniref:junctional adhesion molecule A-like isoform X2 n=1 Tax=Tachypleus tridentatus TaxID=6853 RepID=UPI003FD5075F